MIVPIFVGRSLGRRLDARQLFQRACHALQRRCEIRQVNEREQEGCNPKGVDMCEQGQEPENRNDFELKFLVAHALGQGVERKKGCQFQ